MRTIGLLGGMSWESTAVYYRLLNEAARERGGGLHSAPIVLWSFDFADVQALQRAGDWEGATALLVGAARRVETAGAECLLICTNTMHLMADEVQGAVGVPVLHIADATAARLTADDHHRVGLLGTRFTMEQDFYRARLHDNHGLDVLVPGDDDMGVVHDVIFDELCQGRVDDASRKEFVRVIEDLTARGATAVILGCTEIGLLVDAGHTDVPLYDTTAIHAQAAVDWAAS